MNLWTNGKLLLMKENIYIYITDTRVRCYKTFYVHNLRMFIMSLSGCPKLLQIFVIKAGVFPSEAPFMFSTLG